MPNVLPPTAAASAPRPPYEGFHLHQIDEARTWLNRAYNAAAADVPSLADSLAFTRAAHAHLASALTHEGPGLAIGAAQSVIPRVGRAAQLLAQMDARAGAASLSPVLGEFDAALDVLEATLAAAGR